jgi:hypothetical protein
MQLLDHLWKRFGRFARVWTTSCGHRELCTIRELSQKFARLNESPDKEIAYTINLETRVLSSGMPDSS